MQTVAAADYVVGISIHALCEEGDRLFDGDHRRPDQISIHALCEEGDPRDRGRGAAAADFYPRPLRGGRPVISSLSPLAATLFLSTPSARRATASPPTIRPASPDFYPRPLRGGRPDALPLDGRLRGISIHALCEEGDAVLARRREDDGVFLSTPSARRATHATVNRPTSRKDFYPRPLRGGRRARLRHRHQAQAISIHALCEEGDSSRPPNTTRPTTFLSTPSARRATYYEQRGEAVVEFLSTPSARRATRPRGRSLLRQEISIHALCEEGDNSTFRTFTWLWYFYPRPLRGGRQVVRADGAVLAGISIHALCEEGDCSATARAAPSENFYPRPLRGGRPRSQYRCGFLVRFLSTPSARRATPRNSHLAGGGGISIHALCEEGDYLDYPLGGGDEYFYPRPLRGGRPPPPKTKEEKPCTFLSTPSARRATPDSRDLHGVQSISIHALCEEGDAGASEGDAYGAYFYPRPLRGGRQQKQRQNLYFQTNYTTFCTNLEEL